MLAAGVLSGVGSADAGRWLPAIALLIALPGHGVGQLGITPNRGRPCLWLLVPSGGTALTRHNRRLRGGW